MSMRCERVELRFVFVGRERSSHKVKNSWNSETHFVTMSIWKTPSPKTMTLKASDGEFIINSGESLLTPWGSLYLAQPPEHPKWKDFCGWLYFKGYVPEDNHFQVIRSIPVTLSRCL